MSVCAACGYENQPGAKFCSECGVALVGAEEAPRQERKVVTVLFADLVGFTSRVERMDPEDVRELLSPYYARLRGELKHFGGTVEKFIGDAVMALFGARGLTRTTRSARSGPRSRFATGCSRRSGSRSGSPSAPVRRS